MPSTSSYEGVRETLASPYRELPDEHLEAALEAAGISAEGMEDVFEASGRFGKALGRGLRQALPAVPGFIAGTVKGAKGGAALGPYGMLGGALLGGVRSLARRPANPAGPPGSVAAAGGPSQGPDAPELGTVQSGAPPVPAAGELLSVMFQPQMLQALTAMMLGPMGAPTVPVAGTEVPVAAIPNMVATLAERAAAEYELATSTEAGAESAFLPGFMDSEDPQERADTLLALLHEDVFHDPPSREGMSRSGHFDDGYYEDVDESYDESIDEGWFVEAYVPVYGEALE